ncbi:HAD-IIB family hydrolase [Lacticaseibacillus mingshuiensis]|uniref:HAD-IIB family hydrolase n=1 Tax=Lacticaseibacillus mingshuiensis TaxID=2799574 RepID=A0ABW4CD17_9LACO|nr:HAD family hydrolase [Lacticaseibacillus mingshuiensis]
MIKLIATDLDHTLLLPDGSLPPDTFAVIRQLAARGIEFVAASGRSIPRLDEMFHPVADQMSLVSENGAVVRHRQDPPILHTLAREDWLELIAYTRRQEDGLPLLCALDDSWLAAADQAAAGVIDGFVARQAIIPELADLTMPILKYTVIFPAGDALAHLPEYQRVFGDRFTVTVGMATFLDITAPHASKATGLATLGERLDVSLADMAAFGDDANDGAMIEAVGHGFIMANATPGLAGIKGTRIGTNAEQAVLNTIRKLAFEQPS